MTLATRKQSALGAGDMPRGNPDATLVETPPKRRRGRPPKSATVTLSHSVASTKAKARRSPAPTGERHHGFHGGFDALVSPKSGESVAVGEPVDGGRGATRARAVDGQTHTFKKAEDEGVTFTWANSTSATCSSESLLLNLHQGISSSDLLHSERMSSLQAPLSPPDSQPCSDSEKHEQSSLARSR